MDIFNRDGCLINENSDCKGQASERHDVDRLPGQPKSHQSGQQRERDCCDHDQSASQIAQEEQDHQAGQNRSKRSFDNQPANGVLDIRGLIKLEGNFDVVRKQRLHLWQF